MAKFQMYPYLTIYYTILTFNNPVKETSGFQSDSYFGGSLGLDFYDYRSPGLKKMGDLWLYKFE